MHACLRLVRNMSPSDGMMPFPQGLYAINNSLKFTMQLFFKPTTTKMLGNLKVFTIAVLMRTVLGRTFNIIQVWT